jgi:hypothetical protein
MPFFKEIVTEMITNWVISHVKAAAWEYLAANWAALALYMAVATIVCLIVRKLLSVYGYLPLIVGMVILIIAAWWIGYRSAPEKKVVQTVTRTVEKTIRDDSLVDSLRRRLAALGSEKNAAIARAEAERRNAEAALAKLRRELSAAKAEIERLRRELAAKPQVEVVADEPNAQCVACGHLMNIGDSLRNERVRCRNCGAIMSAKSAWARRAYVLDHTPKAKRK